MSKSLMTKKPQPIVKKHAAVDNRRPSVQFIDKNVIRRRSSGNEKPTQRLSSINSNAESESTDFDYLQQYSEN